MASFSKAVAGTSASYWWSEGNQVAVGREGKGFFVATNHGGLSRTFPTGMPSGDYCNVVQVTNQFSWIHAFKLHPT